MFGRLLLCAIFIPYVYSAGIFERFDEFPLKIITNTTNVQPKCRVAVQKLIESAINGDLHALKMVDATAKLPSGILSGNVNQYGDFDECMDVAEAQYCLTEIDLASVWKPPYSQYKSLVHSHFAFRDTFNDPAHRVPGFTMSRWGFCVPRQCSRRDLIRFLGDFGIDAQIRPGMCQKVIRDPYIPGWGDYFARIFFTFVITSIILAFIIDTYWTNFETKNKSISLKIIMCFSLKNNMKSLFAIREGTDDEIMAIHAARALNAFALLMSHKSVALLFNPYTNRTATIKNFGKGWTIIAKNAIIYTDVFMLISGLLNANSLLTPLMKGKSMKFKEKLINRIFRITPNLLAVILFCTYILPSWGSGPMWPVVVDHHSKLCKKYMWRNLFYIHNYFGFENMCLTHTHQVGIDMQLFLFTPLIVYLVCKWRKTGYFIIGMVALLSTWLRFWVTWKNELSTVIYFGIPISKMFDTANLSYILPTHRATIYLIGVVLAYMLKRPAYNFTRNQLIFGWLIALSSFFGSWFGPYKMAEQDYIYNKLDASLIAALSPIFWGGSIAFAIYLGNNKLAGYLEPFFCWKYFQFSTKIAYSLYLVQFPIYFYNVGKTKTAYEFKSHYLLEIIETSAILFAAIILTLFIEMPFQNIKKALYDKGKMKRTEEQNKKR